MKKGQTVWWNRTDNSHGGREELKKTGPIWIKAKYEHVLDSGDGHLIFLDGKYFIYLGYSDGAMWNVGNGTIKETDPNKPQKPYNLRTVSVVTLDREEVFP